MRSDADDIQLLHEYARNRSQTAFAALMERHIDWVYSAARRQVRDPALAEDVTQSVFLLLARKAKSFGDAPALPGWLFRAARLMSADACKLRRRRAHHERVAQQLKQDRQAMPQDSTSDASSSDWEQVERELDHAIAKLSLRDRQIVLMRFFEQKSHAAVAAALGVSEGASKMRLSRALDKLRRHLDARGATTPSVDALAVLLLAHSVSAAPPHLAAATMSCIATSATTALVKGTLISMTISKLKAAAVAVAAVILVGGVIIGSQVRRTNALPSDASAAPTALNESGESERRWQRRFNEVYALKRDEVLKHVPPPFVPERREWIVGNDSNDITTEVLDERVKAGRTLLTLEWDPAAGRVTQQLGFADGVAVVGTVFYSVLGAESYHLDAPRRLLERPIPGDWVVRKGSSPEERAAALEQILRERTRLAVTIQRLRVPREVIVVSGSLQPQAGVTSLQLYSDRKDAEGPGGSGSGIFLGFLHGLANLTDLKVINQSAAAPDAPMKWTIHRSASASGMPPKRAAVKIDMLLKNIAQQTGLSLQRETRQVEVWQVKAEEKSDAAAAR